MYAGLVIIPNLCLHTQAFPSIPWELRPRILPTERIPTNTRTRTVSGIFLDSERIREMNL